MTMHRNLNYGDRFPEAVADALMEYLSTYAGPNFILSQANATTLQIVAGADNAQAAVGINGRWRYISATVNATHPGGGAATYNVFVTATDNSFVPSGNPPGSSPENDLTVYAFGLQILPVGSNPTTALWRQVGTCTWSGTAITDFTQTVPGQVLPAQSADGTPAMDGTAARGGSPHYARADHIHPMDTSRAPLASPVFTGNPQAPTPALDDNDTSLATTAFVLGQGSTTTPSMDGTGTSGGSSRWARADHVHPIDTSRAPLASPALTGIPAAPTAAVDTNTTQLATTAFVLGQAASATPLMDGAAAVGTSTRYARGDHIHPTDTSRAADSGVVHLAGAESITGVKLFNAGPRLGVQAASASATLVDGSAPAVQVDTTAAAITLTLPAAPSVGSMFTFLDTTGKWATNALTIGRNAKNINGQAANLLISQNYAEVTIIYDGTGWHTIGHSLVSPTFTGLPIGPTAAVDTNTNQLATTGFVIGQGYAKLASPALTGTPAAPTAAVDTNTTQLATTAFVLGQAAAATPLMNGAAAVGTSTRYARADHVHPVDTSLAPIASPTLTGVPAAPTAAVGTNTTQLATTAYVLANASASTPLMDGAAAIGTSTRHARADHVHPVDTSRAPLASPTFTGTVTTPALNVTSTGGFGYAAGAGAAVSCAIGGSVACARPAGTVTSTGSVAAAAQAYYTVTGSPCAAIDGILLTLQNGTTNYASAVPYDICVTHIAAGTFTFFISNNTGTAITPVFNFQIINGVTT